MDKIIRVIYKFSALGNYGISLLKYIFLMLEELKMDLIWSYVRIYYSW